MDHLRRKRKGVEILASSQNDPTPSTLLWSHVSLGDYSRRKKKCIEVVVTETVDSSKNFVTGIVTAPPGVNVRSDPSGRGIKRKIGCIDAATRMGRKKKIEQDYELGPTIGKGKFGSVVMCRSKSSGEEFACKTLRKGEDIVHREVEIMQHLSGHPGVVTLKAVYEDAQSFHLVMELCSGGRLLDQMSIEGQYSEQRAADLMKELMLVIEYCHDMGVVHRDVKPENILLTTSGRMKLADFGLAARISNGQSLSGVVGSPAYVAPEVLAGDYSGKVDIWSAGVLLHALLVGFLPFQGDSLDSVFDAIKKANLNFNGGIWESVSLPARDLIGHMLTRNVSQRFTADDVLRHPWILFYTNPSLETLTFRPKVKNHCRLTSRQLIAVTPGLESERNKVMANSSFSDDSFPSLSCLRSREKREDEDCGMVDVLALAISRVTISEPKRSRLCSPNNPIQQERSSNIKINSLCTAF